MLPIKLIGQGEEGEGEACECVCGGCMKVVGSYANGSQINQFNQFIRRNKQERSIIHSA
jgi:hypothetical protein